MMFNSKFMVTPGKELLTSTEIFRCAYHVAIFNPTFISKETHMIGNITSNGGRLESSSSTGRGIARAGGASLLGLGLGLGLVLSACGSTQVVMDASWCEEHPLTAPLRPVVTRVEALDEGVIQVTGTNLTTPIANTTALMRCEGAACSTEWALTVADGFVATANALAFVLPADAAPGAYSVVINNGCTETSTYFLREERLVPPAPTCQIRMNDEGDIVIRCSESGPEFLVGAFCKLIGTDAVSGTANFMCDKTPVVVPLGAMPAIPDAPECTSSIVNGDIKIDCGTQSKLVDVDSFCTFDAAASSPTIGQFVCANGAAIRVQLDQIGPVGKSAAPADRTFKLSSGMEVLFLDGDKAPGNYFASADACLSYGYDMCSLDEIRRVKNEVNDPRFFMPDSYYWVNDGACFMNRGYPDDVVGNVVVNYADTRDVFLASCLRTTLSYLYFDDDQFDAICCWSKPL